MAQRLITRLRIRLSLRMLYQLWRHQKAQAESKKLLLRMNDDRLKDIGLTRADIHDLFSSGKDR
ncbi:DUF1127 domain-containing protein [Pectobacteriaceae bacterium CE90]|nr:DUF1127 domain-containing protein [Pectobacteriaceae bacterium CE90]